MREIRALLNTEYSFFLPSLQQVWVIPWDRRLSFTGPSFSSICPLFLSLYNLCLSRCKRKCFESYSGVSWPEKKKGIIKSLLWYYNIQGSILLLKLIFYTLHFPPPVVLKPWLHLRITQGAFGTCVTLSAYHQINRIPWGLSIGRL